MVRRAGVGPKPCPVTELTTDKLIEKLRELTSPSTKEAAVELSYKMNAEDGVMAALEHFWYSLPTDSMVCSISLIMGKSLLAKYRTKNWIPISQEVASILDDGGHDNIIPNLPRGVPNLPNAPLGVSNVDIPLEMNVNVDIRIHSIMGSLMNEKVIPYGTTTYALRHRGGYDSVLNGLLSSCTEFWGYMFHSFFQIYAIPDKFARRLGLLGCLVGILACPFYVVYGLYRMIIVFIDRIGVTISNNILDKQWLYYIDPTANAKVYRDMSTLSSTMKKVSDIYALDVRAAREIAIKAKRIFDECKPSFINENWHWREVDLATLESKVIQEKVRVNNGNDSKLGLSGVELDTLTERSSWAKERMESLSYNRFCLFIGEAVKNIFEDSRDSNTRPAKLNEISNPYLA